ncbi:blastopia polyprotein [Vespula maculifrons]|uniref:Blastopia polyprotein n=1 Tax=Vespula maculifrons TaxID=7453 RepID=A0ABD2CKG9_VESMC
MQAENTLDISSHNITDLIGTDSGLMPFTRKKGIYFRHVESDINKILGEFCTNMGIDASDGIVLPYLSDYASPLILPQDQQMNRKIIKDLYPLPLIEDQLDRLQSARILYVSKKGLLVPRYEVED